MRAPEGAQGCQAAKSKSVNTVISEELGDVPFSQNQPLKSTDSWYIGILKNRMKSLESLRISVKTQDQTL
jgi:hypothetical protein